MAGWDLPEVGRKVGNCTLKEKLSSGGGGDVWIGFDGKMDVALKFLKWSPFKEKGKITKKFKEEFAILKGVDHPHIAKIFDFGYDPDLDLYYFTQELISGGDLRKYKSKSIEFLEEVLNQVLEALEYLRRRGILHLDIKPQNILIRSEDPIDSALIDFGLATLRPPDKPGGTPSYMPPEIAARRLGIKGYPKPDHRSDIYSVGASFYFCMASTNPLRKRNPQGMLDTKGTMENHLNLVPPPPSQFRREIPPYLDRVILRMLSKKPSDRYATAEDALEALRYSREKQTGQRWRHLSMYTPTRGKLVGRISELLKIKGLCRAITSKRVSATALGIAGPSGVGKSKLLEAIRPIAQQSELEVVNWDDPGSLNFPRKRPTALLIDDIEKIDPRTERWKKFIRSLSWQRNESSDSEGEGIPTSLQEIDSSYTNEASLTKDLAPFVIFYTYTSRKKDVLKKIAEYSLDELDSETLYLEPFSVEDVSRFLSYITGETPSLSSLSHIMEITGGHPRFLTALVEALIELKGMPLNYLLESPYAVLPYLNFPASLKKDLKYFIPEGVKVDTVDFINLLSCWKNISFEDDKKLIEPIVKTHWPIVQNIPKLFFLIWNQTLPPAARRRINSQIAKSLESKDQKQAYVAETTGNRSIAALFYLLEKFHKANEPLAVLHYCKKLFSRMLTKEEKIAAEEYMAGNLIRLNRYPEAERIFKRWESLGGERKLIGHIERGRTLLKRMQFKQAEKTFNAALRYAKRIQKRYRTKAKKEKWLPRIENYIGACLMRRGRLDEAEKIFRKTLKRNIDNNELAETYLFSGKADKAYRILMKQIKKSRSGGPKLLKGRKFASYQLLLGDTCRRLAASDMSRLAEAQEAYDYALSEAQKNHWWNIQIRAYHHLGNMYLEMADPTRAISQLIKGLNLAKQMDNDIAATEIMTCLGITYRHLGKFKEAAEQLESAWDFSHRRRGSEAAYLKRWWPQLLISLGDIYYHIGDLKAARERLRKAQDFDRAKTLPNPARYNLFGTLVEIEIKAGEIARAKRYVPILKEIVSKLPSASHHFKQLEAQLH